MSGDKDLSPPRKSEGKARATLSQIKMMWGQIDDSNPDRVTRRGMWGQLEVWRRLDDYGIGAKALYEKEAPEGD